MPSRRAAMLMAAALFGACGAPTATPRAQNRLDGATGRADFLRFAAWTGPEIDVHLWRPAAHGPATPLVFVMHGVARGGRGYRDAWAEVADAHGLAIAAPAFSREAFPEAAGYQIGAADDPTRSSHAAIEPMFDAVRAHLGLAAERYGLYGHSAGAQFAHRFLFRTGGPRCARAVCANAGWWMRPLEDAPFPYGLRGAGQAAARLDDALAKPMTVLLGEADLRRDGSLRQTPEAEAQGPHRLARGRSFFAAAQALATRRDLAFAWRLQTVPAVGHSNRHMAPAAAALFG